MAEEIKDNPQESTTEETTTVEGEAQTETAAETQKTLPPLTAERVTDITLGLGKAAVEMLDKAARQLDDSVRQIRTDAPTFLTEMEEKGRPLREKLSESLRGFSITDVFTRTGDKPGGGPEDSPLDDIEALENRVRELEQQVGGDLPVEKAAEPETPAEASPFSMLELDDDPVVATPTVEAPKPAVKKPPVRRKKKEEGSSTAE